MQFSGVDIPARILVIRGGAIGDFVLTLPALRMLRETYPDCHLELLGYQHIVALAEGRFYANASRSIEYGPLASFFTRSGPLDAELSAYFRSFGLIINYLFDPDGIFTGNLHRAGAKLVLPAYAPFNDHQYAAAQLAAPLAHKGLEPLQAHPRLYPTSADLAAAATLLPQDWAGLPVLCLHPGSGSAKKNWPAHRWHHLLHTLAGERPDLRLLILGGEADSAPLAALDQHLAPLREPGRLQVHRDLPLTLVAALLASQVDLFLGHDSGISHIAAAAGAPCLLLFGPSSATVWAPRAPQVSVICSDKPDMAGIRPDAVRTEALRLLAAGTKKGG